MSIILHPNAIEKISNKIKGSLKNCVVKENWPQYESFSVHVDSLSNEILKHKKNLLDRSDVYSIFYDFVYNAIISVTKDGKNIQGNLWDILGDDFSQQLADALKDYFISLPRIFDIYIPLPGITKNLPSQIDLNESISITSFHEADKIPGGYNKGLLGINNKFEIGKVYVRQRISGYAGSSLENIGLKEALSNLKIILQQGIFRSCFVLTPEEKSGLLAFGAMGHHQIKKSTIVIVDNAYENPKVSTVELPIDICRVLNNIDINWELLSPAVKRNELDKVIRSLLRKAVQLIDCQEKEAERVKAASKWYFDSDVVENKTLSFLQVCIGLEALLGDDAYNGALTETLADRCSYLVASDIKGRKTIKEKFTKLYGVRSKLVHGNSSELNSDEIHFLNWGKVILVYAISKEIKHLNLDKT